jgi:hypothetical protein
MAPKRKAARKRKPPPSPEPQPQPEPLMVEFESTEDTIASERDSGEASDDGASTATDKTTASVSHNYRVISITELFL